MHAVRILCTGGFASSANASSANASAELVEHVEECELEAVEVLLKCMYKAELSNETRGKIRLMLQVRPRFQAHATNTLETWMVEASILYPVPLQVYRLADKYEVPNACTEPVFAALSAVEAKDIDLALLSDAYRLPDGLRERPPLQKVTMACKQKLLELFGDVPAVITDLEQRRQFCALPYSAVLAWLQSDDLKVHSESCVLFLLTAWVNSKERQAVCSPDQHKLLAHSVRVTRLSPTYLHCVLPGLKWFQECCSGDVIFVQTLQLMSGHVGASCSPWAGPAAWIVDKRKGTAMPTSIDLEWKLGAGDVLVLDREPVNQSIFSPGKAYLNGIFYGLLAQKAAKAEGGLVTLAVYLQVNSEAMGCVLDFWDNARQPCLYRADLWAADAFRFRLHTVNVSSGLGHRDLLGRAGATINEVVTPSLTEGHLNLKAVIMAV